MAETDPLLRSRSNDQALIDDAQEEEDAFQDVEFQSEGCLDNPMNWPRSYQWGVIALLAFMAFTVSVVVLILEVWGQLLILMVVHSLVLALCPWLAESLWIWRGGRANLLVFFLLRFGSLERRLGL